MDRFVRVAQGEDRMADARVLIVGAGPTGLTLALNLARRGVPFRLISEAEGPGEHSRAMAVQARTRDPWWKLRGIAVLRLAGACVRRCQ